MRKSFLLTYKLTLKIVLGSTLLAFNMQQTSSGSDLILISIVKIVLTAVKLMEIKGNKERSHI